MMRSKLSALRAHGSDSTLVILARPLALPPCSMGMGGEGPPARFHVSLLCRNAVFTEMLPILFPENTQTQARGGGGGGDLHPVCWMEGEACLWRTGGRYQMLPGSSRDALGRGLVVQSWWCTWEILIVFCRIFMGLPCSVFWLCLLQLRIDDCRFLVEIPQTMSS